MCFENQTLKDIKEVHSHPMALLQCKEFFNDYSNISLVEATDTAKVAQLISKKKKTILRLFYPKFFQI